MQLNQQFQEIAEKYKRENEKYEVYPYVLNIPKQMKNFITIFYIKSIKRGKECLSCPQTEVS